MKLLYSLFILFFRLGIRITSLWNAKAKAWLSGRKHLFEELETTFAQGQPTIWMHCASAGEFEQGKPIIQKLKAEFPTYPVVVSFFSPSGFAVGKRFKEADLVVYLPLDTARNARRFVDIINPQLVIFIKYDYWYFHLKEIWNRKVPLLLASAIYRERSIFFKWYGGLHRSMLRFFKHIFVQDQASKKLLNKIDVHHWSVAGDTRFDRVVSIAEQATKLVGIEDFVQGSQVLVAGSTWPDDERLIQSLSAKYPDLKIIIAPHEVHTGHIEQLQSLFPEATLYSRLATGANTNILIIDNIGMLSRLYQYATVTYVGGGFNGSGIHNTLEAAVWGKPAIFGPNYQKFGEATGLIKAGGGFSINSSEEMISVMEKLLDSKDALSAASVNAAQFVKSGTGATKKIIDYIQENRLLTTP